MSSLKQSLRNRIPVVFNAYHFFWAWTGARLHKHPSQRLFVIGVTGTKGKTTTLELINAMLEAAGKKTALLSSLRVKVDSETWKNATGNSMPGRDYTQKFLLRARAMGCRYALIEVTSQGVVSHRHRFIKWNMGVLTNLAPEHIESHGSFEKYRAAKLAFLKYVVTQGGKVFLNRSDASFEFFSKVLGGTKTLEYSREDEYLRDYLPKTTPMREAVDGGEEPQFLLSKFNQENIAVAVAIAKELGISDRFIKDTIMNFKGVAGRMDFISVRPYTAVVDYAHTPDSLEAAYKAMRELIGTRNPNPEIPTPKLICVLGAAGGGRDVWKRPEMGKIATHYCDEIILTDEDPYDEDPQSIIDQIAAGIATMPYPKPDVLKILDRREALEKAVTMMEPGDMLIATGKGSEEWIHQARGKKIPWNEKEVMRSLLVDKR